jgi:hypothetical protein
MRRSPFLMCTLAALLSGGCGLFAEDQPAGGSSPAAGVSGTAPTSPQGATAAKSQRVSGKITAIDATEKTVAITNKQGDATTVKVDDKTTITIDGAASTIADLKVGDRAMARLSLDDADIAVAIKVRRNQQGGKHGADGAPAAGSASPGTPAPSPAGGSAPAGN